MISSVVAAAVAFVFALVCTPLAARGLVRLRAGQPIRDINPAAHQAKRGTPTMGGLVFVVGTVLAYMAGHFVMNVLPEAQIAPSSPTMTRFVLLG
jgi:phospho-N-acetylmuramoyl-pentapeptide-transferase